MRSGAWMLDTSMRIAPTKILLDRVLSQAGVLDRVLSYATWATCWSNGSFGTRQRSTRDSASLHPCRQAAYFLPCERPPDACGYFLDRLRLRLDQGSRDRAEARAFVVTRAGTDTMPTRREEDEIEEDAAPATERGAGRASRFGTRAHATMTPPTPERPPTQDDLRDAMRVPASFGVKLFEINVLQAILAACPDVKDAGDLLILRETLLEDMGPAYMWLINLSLVDWQSLSDDDKALNTQMRLDWLASYSKASEAVLQHWFWKLLKSKTQNFAPLHHVFVRVRPGSPNCGSAAWTDLPLVPLDRCLISFARHSGIQVLGCIPDHHQLRMASNWIRMALQISPLQCRQGRTRREGSTEQMCTLHAGVVLWVCLR